MKTLCHFKISGTFCIYLDIEIRPEPATNTNKHPAKRIRSVSIAANSKGIQICLIIIAPNMIMAKTPDEILVKKPKIKNIPPKHSTNAIGICNSTGSPILVRYSAKDGLNLLIPTVMNKIPIDNFNPQNANSNFLLILIQVIYLINRIKDLTDMVQLQNQTCKSSTLEIKNN